MPSTHLPLRKDVPNELKWDLSLLYSDDQAMQADLAEITKLTAQLGDMKGHLGDSAQALTQVLQASRDLDVKLEKAYVYAFLRRDSDTTDARANNLFGQAAQTLVQVQTQTAFIEPELLALPEDKLANWLTTSPALQEFAVEIKRMRLQRGHVLKTSEEALLNRLNRTLDSAEEIYNTLNDADLKFGQIKDEHGQWVELTHGNRSQYTESMDRSVRQAAVKAYAKPYHDLRNTFAQTFNSFVSSQNAQAEIRHYQSARQAALTPHQIDEQVYDTLVTTVNDHLDLAHRWYAIKQRTLGISDFSQADLNVPLAGNEVMKTTFSQGKELTLAALAVLGDDYVKGLQTEFNQRWIDVAENKGKRSGGYQVSVYDGNPFILLNWTDKLYSTFVLAHESGHAMHSWFSQHHQPAQYADAPIFLAEVASTFNENILTEYLLAKYQDDPQIQLYVLEESINGYIGSIFRQTQFAEFEHQAYQAEQDGQTLTADYLDQLSTELLHRYYGPQVSLLAGGASQSWAYVPHFYMNYYVYQYATSWAASSSLAQQVWAGQTGALDRYLGFLKSGSSKDPIETMQAAGIDMTGRAYLDQALKMFAERLDQIEDLLKHQK